jgi:outer membrane protein OmpA-like peptidoglycan-associated protein
LQAFFELIDLSNGNLVTSSSSDPVDGEFLLSLPTGKDYALNVSKPGYLFYSDNFALRGINTRATPFIKDIPLKKIKAGETVVLKNIFFDTDKYTLKSESLIELDRLVALLKANPSLRIEISGHTDNQGGAAYNVTLSKNRAKTVYDYLIGHGIDASRLAYEGYGLTRPVDTNATEEGRANNRRTEFRVL